MEPSLGVTGETKIALLRHELCTLIGSHILQLKIKAVFQCLRQPSKVKLVAINGHAIVSKS